ncbi:MAG: glycosyltransferase family 4 protein [Thiomicrorhabdus sp.]|nr:glycosyltransferase family 4 protein [Thiomicrorhabdus sp.]
MNILIVTRENEADKKYGLGKSIQRIAVEFKAMGHHVHYFSQTECAAAHHKWHPRLICWLPSCLGILSGAFAERLIQGWMAAKTARKGSFSHVWFQDPWLCFGFNAHYFLKATWVKPFKWGVSEHGLGSFAWAVKQDGLFLSNAVYKYLLRYEKKILLKADWVWSPSESAMTLLLRDMQLSQPPKNWQAMPYGHPELSSTSDSFLSPNSPPRIIALGRIAPAKKYQILIDAIHLLQTQYHIEAQLIILGGGDKNRLMQYALKKGVKYPPEIREICIQKSSDVESGGVGNRRIDNKSLEQALEHADIYTSACHVESFGLANREAIAYGLPCVISAGGASCEVLGDGAWLVPNEAQYFAKAYYQLLTNPELQQFWKKQALNAAQNWPNWKTVSTHYEQTLLTL